MALWLDTPVLSVNIVNYDKGKINITWSMNSAAFTPCMVLKLMSIDTCVSLSIIFTIGTKAPDNTFIDSASPEVVKAFAVSCNKQNKINK